jgi:hypothetical protein
MNDNENLVVNEPIETTEAVAQPTEEVKPKLYTEDELNARVDELLGQKIARKTAKIKKEYDREYGELVDVLKVGLGKDNVKDITSSLKGYYEKKGHKFQEATSYNDSDVKILAEADAKDIIKSGFDEVVEEVDRLANIGVANMTAREKALFKTLAEHRQKEERNKELAKNGVTKDVYESEEFVTFASQFTSDVPITKVYSQYEQLKPKKQVQTMGSMKNTTDDTGVKDYYSYEEAMKFTKADFDRDPKLYQAVINSMTKW